MNKMYFILWNELLTLIADLRIAWRTCSSKNRLFFKKTAFWNSFLITWRGSMVSQAPDTSSKCQKTLQRNSARTCVSYCKTFSTCSSWSERFGRSIFSAQKIKNRFSKNRLFFKKTAFWNSFL